MTKRDPQSYVWIYIIQQQNKMSCSTNFTCACDDDDVEERTAMQLQFCYPDKNEKTWRMNEKCDYYCDVCVQSINTCCKLKMHIQPNHKIKPYLFNFCEQLTKTTVKLKVYIMKKKMSVNQIQCDCLGKLINSSYQLNVHILTKH